MGDNPSACGRREIGIQVSSGFDNEVIGDERLFHPRGVNEKGERYYVYSFLLYADGMSISRVNASSAEGICIVPLNFPDTFRNTKDFCRVINLAPPGISPYSVINSITDDIVKGPKEGILTYDADVFPRIYLDCVGFIGDTPAIGKGLDVSGHTGGTFCHLCTRQKNSETVEGRVFGEPGKMSSLTAKGRYRFKHEAVNDWNPADGTLTKLGMKRLENSVLTDRGFSHLLAEKLASIGDTGPKDEHGRKILSIHLDPYALAFITTDHLLTGLFRDGFEFATFALKILCVAIYLRKTT